MSAIITEAVKPSAITLELWHIAGTGDVEQLNQLLNQGAEVNAGDRTGVTALMRAAYHGQLQMVRALIEHGADPNATDRGGLNALTMAKHAGHQEVVEALLSLGAKGKDKADKPRIVGRINDEGSDAADSPVETTPRKTSPVRTLHEPPEIWDLVNTNNVADPEEGAPDQTSKVKTLHEPPEIWDMVNTKSAEAYSASAVPSQFNFTRPLVFGAALIVCAALAFGLWYVRRASQAAAASSEPNQTVVTKPTPQSRQAATTTRTKTNEPERAARQSKDSVNLTPAGKASSQRPEQAAPKSALIALTAKPVTKKRNNGTQMSNARFREADDSVIRKEGNARKAKPQTGQPAQSASLKKDTAKPQTQQPSESPKPNVTKPKVIPWP
jgi:hypothetical protein